MNQEFHYWVTLYICRRAGLSPQSSERIAYSSQLVDDRTYPLSIAGPWGQETFPATQPLDAEGGREVVRTRMSFHFVPGRQAEAAALRVDGLPPALVVTPNSPNAKALLVGALKSRDEYRIGIALHAYADTWAHQNFSALKDRGNVFYEGDPIPPIGHATALKKPDLLNEVWEDPRLLQDYRRVINRRRFTEAARMMYKYLAVYMRKSYDDVDRVEEDLGRLWGTPGVKDRRERCLDYQLETEAADYDKQAWTTAAGLDIPRPGAASSYAARLLRRGGEWLAGRLGTELVEVDASFRDSDLYRWMIAAAAHAAALEGLASI